MNRNEQIETLEATLTDEQAKFLSLTDWEPLPTQEIFDEWLGEFLTAWDSDEAAMQKALTHLDEILGN